VAIGLPLVLSEHGLGSADFGADPDGVVDYVSSIIRQPTTDSGWVEPSGLGACPGTVARVVTWRDLALFFGDEAESFRGRRHFFGYTYGPPFAAEIDPAGPATDGGITVGSTVQQLQTVFPAAGVNPADDSTPANFTIVEGLSGYLTGAGESDTITQFVGGLVCGE